MLSLTWFCIFFCYSLNPTPPLPPPKKKKLLKLLSDLCANMSKIPNLWVILRDNS